MLAPDAGTAGDGHETPTEDEPAPLSHVGEAIVKALTAGAPGRPGQLLPALDLLPGAFLPDALEAVHGHGITFVAIAFDWVHKSVAALTGALAAVGSAMAMGVRLKCFRYFSGRRMDPNFSCWRRTGCSRWLLDSSK